MRSDQTRGPGPGPELIPGSPSWSFRVLRQLAAARSGAGDAAEIWRTASAIPAGDAVAWVDGWRGLAARCGAEGREAEARGRLRTAGGCYLRAAGYLRLAEYELPRDDAPAVRAGYAEIRRLFRCGLALLGERVEAVSVPFAGGQLDGYLVLPRRIYRPVPAVVFLGGADTFAEESYFLAGTALAERGLAQLIVDGPGRGAAIRLHGLLARHDYEVPVAAMIDHLAARPDVRAEAIGLWGLSMGGYYAPRAAAFDARVRALCCWGACYDVVADLFDHAPPLRPQLRWIVAADDDRQARERLRPFNLEGVASRIACPTLILHGEEDPIVHPRSAERLYAEVAGPKELQVFRRTAGAGFGHCQWDLHASVLPRMADWLAEALGGA